MSTSQSIALPRWPGEQVIRELLERRVLHAVGFYVGASLGPTRMRVRSIPPEASRQNGGRSRPAPPRKPER